jgi:hypothetical protein
MNSLKSCSLWKLTKIVTKQPVVGPKKGETLIPCRLTATVVTEVEVETIVVVTVAGSRLVVTVVRTITSGEVVVDVEVTVVRETLVVVPVTKEVVDVAGTTSVETMVVVVWTVEVVVGRDVT